MPIGTIDEFLKVVSLTKRVQFFQIVYSRTHTPGGKGDSLLVKSRQSTKGNIIPTPWESVRHVKRQNALLGVDYAKMVNNQRQKEAKFALEEVQRSLPVHVKLTAEVEVFIPEKLWYGKGAPDDFYPDFAVKHIESGKRYLKYWPACDELGKPIPNEVHYYDEKGKEIDKKELKENYWKKSSDDDDEENDNKTQGTIKPIRWQINTFEHIVQISSGGLVWNFNHQER